MMSKDLMYYLITKMHLRLNELIVSKDFNLLDEEVQHYSRRLDKVLSHYDKIVKNDSYSSLMPRNRIVFQNVLSGCSI